MEKTFALGWNGYGDPKFEVTVYKDGVVRITERDPFNGLPADSIVLKPDELKTLFAELNLK